MKKICYILPKYSEKISEHFYYQYELLRESSNLPAGKAGKLDIFLIVERGIERMGLGDFKRVYIQKFKFLPLRFLESLFIVLYARILGYKNFYTHYCYIGGINAAIISRLFGGKSYYWHCEMIWEFKQKFLSKIGFNLALKLSHFLVTGSESLKKEYSKHYGFREQNIKVMPNWINLERFQIPNTKYKIQDTRYILFVHWLAERKGAHLLIPIAKQLSKILNTKYKLLVVGEGPLKEKILQEIKENKLEEVIQVLGKVPNRELVDYYNKADIFIMPSLQEGFPHVLLEAMAFGIPYVASDVGAVQEISPKIAHKFIVKRGDVETFAEKIRILLSNKDIYDKFRQEELEKVKEYSLDKIANKFINLFI